MKPLLIRWSAALFRAVLSLVGVLVIVIAVLTLGARLGLPFVAGYKNDIEHALTDYLGRSVAIEELSVAWRASGPVLNAGGLVIGDRAAGRAVVDSALLDLDIFASAWRRRLVLNELTLVGADLQLARAADGGLSLQGFGGRPVSPSTDQTSATEESAGSTRALAWLFDARRVGLVDTRLELIDVERDQRFAFESLALSVENGDGQHRVRLAVDLPEALGGRIEIGADLADGLERVRLDGSGIDALDGEVQVRSDRLDLAAVAAILRITTPLSLPDELPGAMLATQVWGRLEGGTLTAVQGELEVDRFTPAPGRNSPTLDSLFVPFRLSRDPDGWQLDADKTRLTRGDEHLTVSRVRAHRADQNSAGQSPRARPAWQVSLTGRPDAAPVSLLAALAGLVPAHLAPAAFAWLDAAAPDGALQGWQATATAGAPGLAPALELDADLSGVSLAPVAAVPGVDGLDLSVQLNERGGTLELGRSGAGLALIAPELRAEPLRLSGLDGALTLARQAQGWSIRGPVNASVGSLVASARVATTFDGKGSALIDLRGDVELGRAEELSSLLPDRLLGREAMSWFDGAFESGAARNGKLLWRGRVGDFPYDDGDGVFSATAQVEGLTLNWAPGWPAARKVRGTVSFDGASVEAQVAQGRIDAMAIDKARIAIADLRASQLTVDASGEGPVPEMLRWATTGPLASFLQPALGDAAGDGRAGLDLSVGVPLSATAFRRFGPLAVDGSMFFRGNRLSFGRADITLDGVTGGVAFDEAGARMHRVQARWLGRPVRLDASTDGEGRQRQMTLDISGVLDAPDVLVHYGLPLDRFVAGASPWAATLTVPFDDERLAKEGVTLSATSEMVGTELRLPQPLGKPASRAARFTLSTAFHDEEPTVRWRVVHENAGGPPLEALADVANGEMLSLAIGLGDRPVNVTGRPGVRIDAGIDVLDADGWVESVAMLIEDLSGGEADQPNAPIVPISGSLQVANLLLRRAPLGAARLKLNSDDDYLNTVVENRYLDGNLRYPRRERRYDGTRWPLTARLTHVEPRIIDALLGDWIEDSEEAPDALPGGPDPRSLPPIEARIGSLAWDRLRVRGVTLRTEPTLAGLDVTALGFTHQDLQVYGEGYWQMADPQGFDATLAGQHRTELSLTAQSGNFESGLQEIGLNGLLGATAGRITAALRWPGPLWLPAVDTLDGRLDMALERGRIVPLEPGAGKLIGLFALQSLPRRLSLDFSDVTHDGLAFSTLTGAADLNDGVLATELLRLTGPVGVIDVTGSTDLAAQTLDQRVTVLPRVSAALPIIGVITGGASAGIGVLIAGGLLKALGVDLDRIGLREYAVTGPWEKPEMGPYEDRR